MSEWVSVLAVFWVLWALDGARLAKWRVFTIANSGSSGAGARTHASGCGKIRFSRLSLPGVLPWSWRMTAADLPLALSPTGVCNQAAGTAGRPADTAPKAQAWRWEEVRETGVASGWVFVNGVRFCADTGHVKASELLALAHLPADARESAIRRAMRRWLRPAHLRRRAQVLRGRTAHMAALNTVSLVGLAALTLYIVGNFAAELPAFWSERLTQALPWFLLGALAVHVAATVLAWRAVRRLKPVGRGAEKRRTNLFSALLLPAQAMRLRALAGEGVFPAQHPLAAVLAFGATEEKKQWAFNVVADLRWPIESEGNTGDTEEPSRRETACEILDWFRQALESELLPLLRAANLAPETLLAPPLPDAPESCRYCPRCRDQFVEGRATCPHGVPLQPLAPRSGTSQAAS